MDQIRWRCQVTLGSVRTGASAILVLMGHHSTHDRTGSAAVGLVGAHRHHR